MRGTVKFFVLPGGRAPGKKYSPPTRGAYLLTQKPYGSWLSPITTAMLTEDTVHFDQPLFDQNTLYWIEARPSDGGRNVIVRRNPQDGSIEDVTPAPFNVRTRVHEYGGRSYTVHNGTVYFSNFADQRLYRHKPGQPPRAITEEGPVRYAEMTFDVARQRLIAVREDHRLSDIQAETTLVSIHPDHDEFGTVLVAGHDFFSDPRISPDGSKAAWLSWDHPQMPWDGTELWTADATAGGSWEHARKITGSPTDSVLQPEFSPDGTLTFLSDRSGFWNLYRLQDGEARPVYPMDAEFGGPSWVLGITHYVYLNARTIAAIYRQDGIAHWGTIDVDTHVLTEHPTPYTHLAEPVASQENTVVVLAGSWRDPQALVSMALPDGGASPIRVSQHLAVDPQDISIPTAITYPTENGVTAHMTFYPPKNHAFAAPEGEKPPLIVISHGGPTSNSTPMLSLGVQYWTTRGFAVADMDYGGSTGYGREYRRRLQNRWGIVDVEDCTNGALYLARQGLADSQRMVIRGGSAGGFTTLACLTFRDVFRAGASYYGVSDIGALARETHKFESRYMDGLVGPWPEAQDVYEARSPLFHAEQISSPVIFFQGLDDKIVLPNQAEMMVDKLRENHVPVAYIAFPGEGHGFRQSANIQRATEAELYFYSRILGFKLASPVEPVPIENL